MRQWALAGGMLLLSVGSLTACATEEPTVSDFCAAVERAPKHDASVAETRSAAAEVERNSPPEIRDEVTAMRKALETVTTVAEMSALDEGGSPVEAASDRYRAYMAKHCGFD